MQQRLPCWVVCVDICCVCCQVGSACCCVTYIMTAGCIALAVDATFGSRLCSLCMLAAHMHLLAGVFCCKLPASAKWHRPTTAAVIGPFWDSREHDCKASGCGWALAQRQTGTGTDCG
jgi:hypothetical protein